MHSQCAVCIMAGILKHDNDLKYVIQIKNVLQCIKSNQYIISKVNIFVSYYTTRTTVHIVFQNENEDTKETYKLMTSKMAIPIYIYNLLNILPNMLLYFWAEWLRKKQSHSSSSTNITIHTWYAGIMVCVKRSFRTTIFYMHTQ